MTEQEFFDLVVGKPWVDRADGPDCFDCWGLVMYSMIHIDGVWPPVVDGYKSGVPTGQAAAEEVASSNWAKSIGRDGDVVWYFDSSGLLAHVGRVMFGKVLHVMSGGRQPVVKLTSKVALDAMHYRTEYVKYAPDHNNEPRG